MEKGSAPAGLPLGPGVRWLAGRAGGLLALEKPAGVRSHPNQAGRIDSGSLLRATYDPDAQAYRVYLPPARSTTAPESGLVRSGDEASGANQRAAAVRWLHLLHRLDGPTSGVILLADNDATLAGRVRQAFARRRVSKTYFAWVRGPWPKGRQAVWKDRIAVSANRNALRAATGSGAGKLAETAVTGEATARIAGRVCSLLKLEPRTGLTHQLRVQCARRNLPILGDATYGDFALNRDLSGLAFGKRLFLHATSIVLDLPAAGSSAGPGPALRFRAESALPGDFAELGRS